ncbi:MAG: 50S ribosomal protein L18 [Acidobacteria bacterium]|nr:50S ribosomal protein L18 [Acidobacteriota bacterium]
MIQKPVRNQARKRIHLRIRKKIQGTPERPRLNIYRSLQHIYTQVIDDTRGCTLVAASSLEKGFPGAAGGNLTGAREVGKLIAQRALAKGIPKVAFDRGGYRYHGRIKALAEAAREAGLQF